MKRQNEFAGAHEFASQGSMLEQPVPEDGSEIQRRELSSLSFEFLSDNCAPACRAVLEAISDANIGHEASYSADRFTLEAISRLRGVLGNHCEVFFVGGGVAANALALAAICRPYESIICTRMAHINKDEGGAVAFFTGGAGWAMPAHEGEKLTPDDIVATMTSRSDVHWQRPTVVSITQPTELGTVYTPAELASLCKAAKAYGMLVHVDGARLANATAFLGPGHPKQLAEMGVDVLTFGATKNGGLFGDVIVALNPAIVPGMTQRLKQAGQLVAKSRFMGASWNAMLEGDLWLKNATHANRMARRLARQLRDAPGLSIMAPVQANSVLITGAAHLLKVLDNELPWRSYAFISPGVRRFTCSWNTRARSVDHLAGEIVRISTRMAA